MKWDIAAYVAKCLVCQQIKVEHQNPADIMQLLFILKWKWDYIIMDFVMGLLKIESGKDVIWVIIDRLTKSAYFLPIKISYSLDRLARLYVNKIVSRYGVLVSIISDIDLRFTF